MKIVILSSSLRPNSLSRVLARQAEQLLAKTKNVETQWVDLREYPLPFCDGDAAYGHPNVAKLQAILGEADVILVGVPIYNYDINAALKNLVEMTGSAWEDKTVGFMCAAGGRSSYMSVMNFSNDLMLDFRSLIIPRFVYAVGSDFEEANGTVSIKTPEIRERLQSLVDAALVLGNVRLKAIS